MKKIFGLVLLAFALLTGNLKGQAAFSVASVTVDADTIDLDTGNVLTFTVKLVNLGNTPYSGFIQLFAAYNGGTNIYPWEYANIDSLMPILVGDTFSFDLHQDIVASDRYGGGDNIILIWPNTGNGAQTLDTASIHVFVRNLVSRLNPQEIDARVKVYPNPATEVLRFNWTDPTYRLEHVRLVNMAGQEVFSSHNAVQEIGLDGLPRGIYLLQLQYEDGLQGIFKVRIE
jgi:archaellum component FlaG (FlaF/FlaG flagellin family)